jgi:hypothetical protein
MTYDSLLVHNTRRKITVAQLVLKSYGVGLMWEAFLLSCRRWVVASL